MLIECRQRSLALLTRFSLPLCNTSFISFPVILWLQIEHYFHLSGQLRSRTLRIFPSIAYIWKCKALLIDVSTVAILGSQSNGNKLVSVFRIFYHYRFIVLFDPLYSNVFSCTLTHSTTDLSLASIMDLSVTSTTLLC